MPNARWRSRREAPRRPETEHKAGDGNRQPEHVAQSIKEVIELEHQDEISMTRSDVLARLVTNLSGSMPYVWLHAVWFGLWMMVNVGLGVTFDDYPFGLLTTIVSLEAIFLSIFVLINQNRQALLSDKRAKVDMQINLISEREITKLIEMTMQVQKTLGIAPHHDAELKEMHKRTRIEPLVAAADSATEDSTRPKRAKRSARRAKE